MRVKRKAMVALWVIAGIGIAILLAFTVLGVVSRSGQPIGLVDGKLAPCPSSPNCVSSEDKTDTKHYTAPISLPADFSGDKVQALKQAITDLGGSVGDVQGPYLSSTFKSKVFGFVDDLELRVDDDTGTIHIRSGSRVGYSDRGVNKRRVEKLKDRLANR